MELRITINLDNAAFEGDSAQTEIRRILRRYADPLVYGPATPAELDMPLVDTNGRVCGYAEIVEG
jgi:hypothetical protein